MFKRQWGCLTRGDVLKCHHWTFGNTQWWTTSELHFEFHFVLWFYQRKKHICKQKVNYMCTVQTLQVTKMLIFFPPVMSWNHLQQKRRNFRGMIWMKMLPLGNSWGSDFLDWFLRKDRCPWGVWRLRLQVIHLTILTVLPYGAVGISWNLYQNTLRALRSKLRKVVFRDFVLSSFAQLMIYRKHFALKRKQTMSSDSETKRAKLTILIFVFQVFLDMVIVHQEQCQKKKKSCYLPVKYGDEHEDDDQCITHDRKHR